MLFSNSEDDQFCRRCQSSYRIPNQSHKKIPLQKVGVKNFNFKLHNDEFFHDNQSTHLRIDFFERVLELN